MGKLRHHLRIVIGSLLLVLAGQAYSSPLRLVSLHYPPYIETVDGKVDGIATRIVREAFRRIDQPISIEVLPWARSILYIETGQADAIYTIFKNSEREKFADYSQQVLFDQTISLFTLKERHIAYDGRFKTLSGYSFCAVNKVSYGEIFDQAVEAGVINQINSTTSASQCAQMLTKRRVDIWVNNTYGGFHVADALSLLPSLKVLEPIIQSTPSYIAFSKQNQLTDIRDKLDKALEEMKRDGTYTAMIEGYFKNQ